MTCGYRSSIATPLIAILLALLLTACGGGGSSRAAVPPPSDDTAGTPTTPPPADADVVATFAFQADSPYADTLRDCTYAGEATRTCTIGTLPFLGQDAATPTIEDVMQRVLVSHQWMGDNLRSALQQLPSDLLLMLRSITAVVIASDIRPAFYDPATGAIYLDADFLWLTRAEEAVVTDEEDFRSGFGDPLQFKMPWRYVRNDQRLGIQLNQDGSRNLDQLLPVLGFVLYHELAHAVDFMPQAKMAGINDGQTVEQAILSGAFLSSDWRSAYPLTSQILLDLAQVSFAGATPTEEQTQYLPGDLVGEFVNEGAVQYYAYTTQYEDFATALETVMMDFHFGYQKDTGITDNTPLSDDGIVAWGQRGRIAEHGTNTRVRAAVQAAYPGDLSIVETFLDNLPPPLDMAMGETWGNNLVLTPAPAGAGLTQPAAIDFMLPRPIN